MVELDFANVYSSTGKIIQIQYAQKAADAGNNIISIKNSSGVVLLVAKPIESPLHVLESDHRIKKICENVYLAYTGLLHDGQFITSLVKTDVEKYVSEFNSNPPAEFIKRTVSDYLYLFTQSLYSRIIGANFLIIVRENTKYKIFGADCSGKIREYRAFAYGAGHRRAKTELEKLDTESMNIEDMIDQGVKTIFKCFDPLTDLPFNIEACVMAEDTNGEFRRVEQSKIDSLLEKYKYVSIEGDD